MTAFTAGIPLSIPVEVNTYERYRDFLPGVRALGDILRDAGYRQALMVGSDASSEAGTNSTGSMAWNVCWMCSPPNATA